MPNPPSASRITNFARWLDGNTGKGFFPGQAYFELTIPSVFVTKSGVDVRICIFRGLSEPPVTRDYNKSTILPVPGCYYLSRLSKLISKAAAAWRIKKARSPVSHGSDDDIGSLRASNEDTVGSNLLARGK